MKNVLWTGGWDSTYRVLDLIINQQETVQPFYLMDGERSSTQIELRTIQAVREQLTESFPEALALLKPLQTYHSHEVEKDREITEASRAIRRKAVMGSQYDWIARFVKQQKKGRVELSIHRDDKARDVVTNYVEREECTVHIGDKFTGTPEHTLFRWFDFPLFDKTKIEMKTHARNSGFLDILEQGWFCHYPIRNEACGRCGPCRYTIEEGMGYRLSWQARFVRYPRRLAERWLLRTLPPSALSFLRAIKKRIRI